MASQQDLQSRKRLKNIVYPDGSGIRELPHKTSASTQEQKIKKMRQQMLQFESSVRNAAVKAQPRQKQQIANKLQPKQSRDVVAAYDRAFKKNAKK